MLSVGARVTRFKPGDAVYARASRETIGTFAEKIALSQEFVALKPVTVSHAQAAALPLVGLTTLQGFSRVKARAGQRILIHAGAGGIGTFAVQYAQASRPRGHHDHELEECRVRQIARCRQGDCL